MAAIGKILDRIEDNEKPLVEHLIRYFERQYSLQTADALAKIGNKIFIRLSKPSKRAILFSSWMTKIVIL